MKVISLILIAAYVAEVRGMTQLLPANFCGLLTDTPKCNPNSPFRTMNGYCNNLKHPKMGAENNVYQRLFEARYEDGIWEFQKSVLGGPLPNPRYLSLKLFDNKNVTSHEFSTMLPLFGQFLAEDFGSTAEFLLLYKKCCDEFGQLESPLDAMCSYIPIGRKDPTYKEMPRKCMNFLRVQTDLNSKCPGFEKKGPASQLNQVTSYIDHSTTYGSSDADAKLVRSFENGLLKTKNIHGKEYPPHPSSQSVCTEENQQSKCYLGGDIRINEHPAAASLHLIFIREHNRIAKELAQLNPHWDDERLFQETRRIQIAVLQYLMYYEYNPEIIGWDRMERHEVVYHSRKHIDDYDPDMDAGAVIESSNAANRFFHGIVTADFALVSKQERVVGAIPLKDVYFRPGHIENGTVMDDIQRGLCRSAAIEPGRHLDDSVKEFLFRRNTKFALDIKAIDIQRGRDAGLGSYNDAREFCGMKRAITWSGFSDEIEQRDIDNLRSSYAHPDDVELVVGGSLERILQGAAAGRTFTCILIKQLYIARTSDRFFFENNNPHTRFTGLQLKQIRKMSLARLICDNGNNIDRMQRNVFRLPSIRNPIVECNRIPKMSLKYWKDHPIQEE